MQQNNDVTFLLPLAKENAWLHETLDSINQQTFRDWIITAVLWESDSENENVLREMIPPDRIRIIRVPNGSSLSKSLNEGIRLSPEPLIARIDGDDICYRERLQKQIDYLDLHPNVSVLATCVDLIDSKGSYTGKLTCPLEHNEIRKELFRRNCIPHPSVILRRHVFNDYKYDVNNSKLQDYDLWLKLVNHFTFASLPMPLLKYRRHDNQDSRKSINFTDFYSVLLSKLKACRNLREYGLVLSVHLIWVLFKKIFS
jgi:glycosyltransferase involved in cell wall biosynthesis